MKTFNKIQKYQKKALLQLLGCTDKKLLSAGNDYTLDNALWHYQTSQPDEYQKWVNIIYNGILPKDSSTKENNIFLMAKAAEEMIAEYEGKAIERIRDVFIAETEDVVVEAKLSAAECAKTIIEEARKEFICVEYVIKTPTKTNKIEGPLPECFQTILDLASARINILLTGPSGCGKTHTAIQLAKAMGLPFSGQSCSAGMSESIFSGWLLPIGDNNKFSYVKSAFIDIYENGGVFLFDEIDASDSNTLLFLNQALANEYFYLPQRFDNPKVVKHKDFIAIAAANTYGNGATAIYSGRNALDAATLDRFRMGFVEMDYSSEVETKLVDSEIYEWGLNIRHLIKTYKLKRIMSTRVMLDATKMKRELNWSMSKIAKSYYSDWSQEEINRIGVTI